MATTERFSSFVEFWPFYVCEHSVPATRILHFVGTATIAPLAAAAILYSPWFFLAIPFSAYGFAWIAHFLVERNRPATFTYPVWSLMGDFRMFALMCAGRMSKEVQRCQHLRSSS
ncbi:MAG: DUF962 domain-containing protein [Acidiferrobacteraceae bacterium]|jgi:hypothetical protein